MNAISDEAGMEVDWMWPQASDQCFMSHKPYITEDIPYKTGDIPYVTGYNWYTMLIKPILFSVCLKTEFPDPQSSVIIDHP